MPNQRREICLDSFKLGSYAARAKARLRFKGADGIVRGGTLNIDAELSDELRERIRFEIEKEIAAQIGDDVETFSDGTVSPIDDEDIPF